MGVLRDSYGVASPAVAPRTGFLDSPHIATRAGWALLALGLANLAGGLSLGASEAASTRTMLEAIHANFTPCAWAMILCASVVAGGASRSPCAAAGILCSIALGGLTAAGILCVGYQAAKGGVVEPTLYLHGLHFNLAWPALHLAVLAACAQALARQPWWGAAAAGAVALGTNFAFDHPLLAFGAPVSAWSAMNGYGPFLGPHLAAGVFWSAALALLLIGVECRRRRRVSGHSLAGAWLAVVVCGLSGVWILRNAPPKPPMPAVPQVPEPQPKYTRLDLQVDFDVARHRIRSRGTAVMVNRHDVPIRVLRFVFGPGVTVRQLRLTAKSMTSASAEVRNYQLNRPLAPRETLKIAFDIEHMEHPFDPRQRIVANGAWATLAQLVPPLGEASAPVALRIRVGTSLDQVAVAPGLRKGEWRENGRSFFAYEAQAVPLRTQVRSGRYVTSSACWRGVAISVHHHPAHAWRVPKVVSQAKQLLSEWTARGAYPHRWLHLVEVPDYAAIAAPPNLLAFGWRQAEPPGPRSTGAPPGNNVVATQTGVVPYSERRPLD